MDLIRITLAQNALVIGGFSHAKQSISNSNAKG